MASFATLFSLYATSHFYFAFELIIVSAVYGVFTRQIGYIALYFWPVWLVSLSLFLSPWLFNPQSFRGLSVREHFHEFLCWLDDANGLTVSAGKNTWTTWHAHRMKGVRASRRADRFFSILTRQALPRLIIFAACCAALDVASYAPLADDDAGGYETARRLQTAADNLTLFGTTAPSASTANPMVHFRSLLLLSCGGIFCLVGFLVYLLLDHRLVRRALPGSRWWHLLYEWVVRVAAVVIYLVSVTFIIYEPILGAAPSPSHRRALATAAPVGGATDKNLFIAVVVGIACQSLPGA